jgi:transcriptional regulator with XRE-family HTH domain
MTVQPLTKLRKARIRKGLTQKQLAEMVGISESYYCQLETGVRRLSLPLAQEIATILGKSLDSLFMPSNLAVRRAKEEPTRTTQAG